MNSVFSVTCRTLTCLSWATIVLAGCSSSNQSVDISLHDCELGPVADEMLLSTGQPTAEGSVRLPNGDWVGPLATTYEVGRQPMGMAVSPDKKLLVVANTAPDGHRLKEGTYPVGGASITSQSRSLSVFGLDGTDATLVQTIPVEDLSGDIGFDADANMLFAAGGTSESIYLFQPNIDPKGPPLLASPQGPHINASSAFPVDGVPIALAVNPHDDVWAIAMQDQNGVVTVDLHSGKQVTLPTQHKPSVVRFGDKGLSIFALSREGESIERLVWDGSELRNSKHVVIDGGLQTMLYDRDSNRLIALLAEDDAIVVLEPEALDIVGRYPIDPDSKNVGAKPTDLILDAESHRLYVTLAGDHAVAVYDTETWERLYRFPTGPIPVAIEFGQTADDLFVLSADGIVQPSDLGLDRLRPVGSLSRHKAEINPDVQVQLEAAVVQNHSMAERSFVAPCDVAAIPIPRKTTDETPIRHIVLIVIGNTTYDAVLGDLSKADDGLRPDAVTNLFPQELTPNLHRLAKRYTNHVNATVDAHVWAEFGDFVSGLAPNFFRSYGAPLSVVSSLASAAPENNLFGQRDTERIVPFLQDLQAGQLADLTTVVLPGNQTVGVTPGRATPTSMVADNDEAIGQVVDALSYSPFWQTTTVFVVPGTASGYPDRIHPNRAPLLVAGPWTKRGHVSDVGVSVASILQTIALFLHASTNLSPINRAIPLYDAYVFEPDFSPYDAISMRVPYERFGDDLVGIRGQKETEAVNLNHIDAAQQLAYAVWTHLRPNALYNDFNHPKIDIRAYNDAVTRQGDRP